MQNHESVMRNCERAKRNNNEWAEVRDYETTKERCEQRQGDAKRRDYETTRLRNNERVMRNYERTMQKSEILDTITSSV